MADADSGTDEQSATAGDDIDAVRAAFIAGNLDGGEEAAAVVAKAAPKATPAEDDDSDLEADDDADVDDGDDELAAASDDDDEEQAAAAEDDPDADLDEDVKPKVDADTAKRMEQLRKTERRMRDQLAKERADLTREIEKRELELKPKIEAADKFEKLKSRGFVAAIEALAAEFGADDDEIDLAAKRFYAMSKAGRSDPKWKAAVDAMLKDRERDSEIKSVQKQLEDQKQAEKQAKIEAEGRRNADAFIGKAADLVIGKRATLAEKTPLVKHLLESDAEGARGEMFVIASQLAEKQGRLPEHREVVIAYEKQQRQLLRRFGLDPKTIKPGTAAAAPVATKAKPATKAVDKTATNGKAAKAADTNESPLTKDDFMRGRLH